VWECLFFNPIPSHSQWFIPTPRFNLVLFQFPSHSHRFNSHSLLLPYSHTANSISSDNRWPGNSTMHRSFHSLPFPSSRSHSHSHSHETSLVNPIPMGIPWVSHGTHGNSHIMHTSKSYPDTVLLVSCHRLVFSTVFYVLFLYIWLCFLCLWLYTIAVHNTTQNSSNNFHYYSWNNPHISDVVYWWERTDKMWTKRVTSPR